MKRSLIISFIIFLSIVKTSFAQEKEIITNSSFQLIVRVVDKKTNSTIRDAKVYVNTKQYPFLFVKDYFLVKAKSGDQLMVTHKDFDTVYYQIKTDEDIKILVENYYKTSPRKKLSTYSRTDNTNFLAFIDSAKFYKKRDIEKSLTFLEFALKENASSSRNHEAYKLLGDVYLYWKQYDLALKNYANSLRYKKDNDVSILYANSLLLADSTLFAVKELQDLQKQNLSTYQKVQVFETLGDAFLKLNQFNNAKTNYQKALKIAEDNLITPKITDINSKIADVFVAEGKIQKANAQYNNALLLAAKENKTRSIKEKEKVANFYNKNRQFDKEIQLRKETLKEADDQITNDTIFNEPNVNPITPQTINYKIGRAYVEKGDNEKAIPFLKKSIENSDTRSDLSIKKDATRKLSEVYAKTGNYDKALKTYQEYVQVVDSLYLKREQEIEIAKRLGLKIAEKDNRITGLEKDKVLSDSKISLVLKDQQLTSVRNKNQLIIIYSLIGGIGLMIVLVSLLVRNNKQQKLANNLLALKSMRSQMNPHFIFNALNSVNSFIAVSDERNANRYLSEFSTLMRSVLENSDEDFIPLTKEIELLELYTKLEHNRFKDKFDYQISVDKTIDLESFVIPPMLLQPYIENAIWHGLRYKKEKGVLNIELSKINESSVKIMIQDNGVGRKKSMELKTKNQLKQKSKGMSTIQNRIQILNDMYQNKILVSVTDLNDDETGTKVELILNKN